ncbi:MAG: ABC transporter ATP-binding protein [Candidatus Bipolaricaulia bacterium]
MTAPLLACERVSKLYRLGRSTVRAVQSVDLVLEDGEFLALVGPSGSGKSTLLHLLGGLDVPSDGRVRYRTQDLSTLNGTQLADWRAEHVGFVFQTFQLVPTLTALENAALPLLFKGMSPQERQERARNKLDHVGLSQRLDHQPSELSGGEQQRVALARALVGEPDLLLADEPTGNLDSATGATILDLLNDLHDDGIAIVLATHDVQAAARAERSIRLHDGQVQPTE